MLHIFVGSIHIQLGRYWEVPVLDDGSEVATILPPDIEISPFQTLAR